MMDALARKKQNVEIRHVVHALSHGEADRLDEVAPSKTKRGALRRAFNGMCRFAVASIVILAGVAASADEIHCVAKSYSKDPNDADYWSNNEAPVPENTYLVSDGWQLTTGKNDSQNYVFGGGLLTIGESATKYGILRPVGKNNTSSFPHGIRIYNGDTSSVNMGNSGSQQSPDMNTYTHKLYGDIELLSTYKASPQIKFNYRSNGQHLYFMGKLTGASDTGMGFYSGEWSNVNTNNFTFFTGDLSAFYGTLSVQYGAALPTGAHTLALGTTTMPGTVDLCTTVSFFRTATIDDTATIGSLKMADQSTLRPQVDPVNGKSGLIVVTTSFTQTGRQYVWVDCTTAFDTAPHAAHSIPVLTVPLDSAENLKEENFTVFATGCPNGVPEGAFTLRVANNAQGLPTLYVDVAKYGSTDMPSLTTSDGSQESAFLEAYASHWTPSGVPTGGKDYLVAGQTLRTPYLPAASNTAPPGETQTFGGDSLTLGKGENQGTLDLWSWAKVEIAKLVISNGCILSRSNWSGLRGCILEADTTIAATAAARAAFGMTGTWQHLYLAGSWHGKADAQAMIHTSSNLNDAHVWAETEDYFGTLIARGDNSAATLKLWMGCRHFPGTLQLGETTDSGEAAISLTCTNAPVYAKWIVNRPTTLNTSFDGGTFAPNYGVISVTNALELNASVTISTAVTGGDVLPREDNHAAAFIPVIRWPKTLAVDETKFVKGVFTGLDVTPADFFEMTCRDDGDWRVLGFAKREVISLIASDDSLTNATLGAYSARCSFDQKYTGANPGRADGWNWSINERPREGVDYFVSGRTLRTNSGLAEETFQGHALYFCGTLIHQSKTLTVSNAYMVGSANITHSHPDGWRDFLDVAPGGTRKVFGKIHVTAKGGQVSAPPCFAQANCLYLGCDFDGSGDLKCIMNQSSAYSGKLSYVWFAGANGGLSGAMLIGYAAARASAEERLMVLFDDSDSFGGEPAALSYQMVTLTDWSTLWARETKTYVRERRGLFVKRNAGLRVDDGAVFTLDAPLALRGTLFKDGAGTAFFMKTPVFLDSDSDGKPCAPLAGSNVVYVAEGHVGVTGNSQALNGTKIVLAEGAGLCAKAGDAATAAQGIVNTLTDEPFATETADNKIEVVFAMPEAGDPVSITAGVCTVTAAADETLGLQSRLSLKRPRRYKVTCVRTVDAQAGTVSYTAVLERAGLVFLFR